MTSTLMARGIACRPLVLFAAFTVIMAFAVTARGADLTYEPLRAWNGKKVYLSPARHSPDNVGCGNFKESESAFATAWYAGSGSYYRDAANRTSQYRNLRARGYRVRIGRGTVSSAISNSNAWAADVHIPIHSNAGALACDSTNTSRFGTLVIFQSYGGGNGEHLAGELRNSYGAASPGTNDFVCHNSESCTRFNCLGELCSTNAKAAYLEREFHTWNTGVDFLNNGRLYAWRIGTAVDRFLGYPR